MRLESDFALEETIKAQQSAADPKHSAWVDANAGSGKTKVLTDRVIRLLLTGVPAYKILCITFTKAAAAQMADRLFQRLGSWALMNDEELTEQLKELGEEITGEQQLSRARKLFARALETPGGLKIQTIHSFCERVLKRFPLEAGVAPGFSVLEEGEAKHKLEEFVDHAADNPDLSIYLENIISEKSEEQLRQVLKQYLNKIDIITECKEKLGEVEYWQEIASLFEVRVDETEEECKQAFFATFDYTYFERMYSATLDSGTATEKKNAVHIATVLNAKGLDEKLEAAYKYLLTASFTVKARLATKGILKILPDAADKLQDIALEFLSLRNRLLGIQSLSLAKSFDACASNINEQYQAYKLKSGTLDFNDLIRLTAQLFSNVGPSWVLYKLDEAIEHLLLDEAQDTSKEQWDVIIQPLQEFFQEGTGRHRTVFVVGDEKQSIYSFQGANVDLFKEKQSELYQMVQGSGEQFVRQQLTLSFRSTSAVLNFVDHVFDAERTKGVSSDAEIVHTARREGEAGLVELWPMVIREKEEKGNPWDAPVDQTTPDSPVKKIATQITGMISKWLNEGEILTSKNRPILPSDIMILCQKRNAVFHEIVRSLAKERIPTSGADRVKLLEEVVVQDFISILRFALQPMDDLSLAEVLKSPLFGFGEEELYEVCQPRPKAMSIWQFMSDIADGIRQSSISQKIKEAVERLRLSRSIGMRKGPYAFYSHILSDSAPTGYQKIYERLGQGSNEIIQEFLNEVLNFESQNPRTLQGFLHHAEQLETEIKKEIDAADGLVQVMTVHGSKGLEASIVILADAEQMPSSKLDDLCELKEESGLFAVKGQGKTSVAAIEDARTLQKASQYEEYKRLFYVAMTRAEDRLYIFGKQRGNTAVDKLLNGKGKDASWYAMAHQTFSNLLEEEKASVVQEASWGGSVLRFEHNQLKPLKDQVSEEHSQSYELPEWAHTKEDLEKPQRIISPSLLGHENDDDILVPLGEAAYTPQENEKGISPLTRGNALHLLLEKLPDHPKDQLSEYGEKLLSLRYGEVDEKVRSQWVEEVVSILGDQIFSGVFGEGSRAEVPLVGHVVASKGEKVLLSGQIDRLLVTDDQILIVDYKTNRPPPKDAALVSNAYRAQLAAYKMLLEQIYPNRKVDCAILWTWEARLMPIPDALLDHAFVQRV